MNNQEIQVSEIQSEDSDVPLINYLKKYYPQTTIKEWNNWNWQLKNGITNIDKLKFLLINNNVNDLIKDFPNIPFRITPYFTYLLSTLSINHSLYKTVIPTIHELDINEGENLDPLGEEKNSPVSNIVHRYPDRVLFLVTNYCSYKCRFCCRSRIVFNENNKIKSSISDWEKGFKYIEEHKEIRDVIVSGGDPLTLKDEQIDYILKRLRNIKHIEIIRIGTKVPVVLPMRITTKLVNILKKYHPLYINIHFTLPDELTIETQKACNMLANAGIPLGSQTVLLKDVNDDVVVMRKLNTGLLKCRVRPLYLYQMDKILGGKHFETSINKGLEIIKGLRGHTSGLAVPHFVIDAPGGGGKIPLLPNYVKEIRKDAIVLTNYLDKEYYYPL